MILDDADGDDDLIMIAIRIRPIFIITIAPIITVVSTSTTLQSLATAHSRFFVVNDKTHLELGVVGC